MKMPPFHDLMNRRERLAGWVYFPLHFLLFPLLSIRYAPELERFGAGRVNLVYYGVGLLFLAVFLLPWLYRQYNILCDRPIWCMGSLAGGYLLNYLLSSVVVLLLMSVEVETGENPNNAYILSQQGFDGRAVKALSIYIAPLMEETLMRGVVFGTLRQKSRPLAYVLSVLLFSFCHVWQYALLSGDVQLWLYLIQYIPASVALCYCYERSGSIWTPILLHTLLNVMAFSVLSL